MKQMTEGCAVVDGVQQTLVKGPPGSEEGSGDVIVAQNDVVTSSSSATTSTGCENGTMSRKNEKGKGVGATGSPQEVAVDTNGDYRVRRPFRKVLRSLPNVDQNKSVFSYKEVGTIPSILTTFL